MYYNMTNKELLRKGDATMKKTTLKLTALLFWWKRAA